MADTKRLTILKAAETLLRGLEGGAPTFRLVQRLHPQPHKVDTLPAAFVYGTEEELEPGTDDGIKKRLGLIVLIIFEAGSDGLMDGAEALIGQVERLIETDPGRTLSGTVDDARVSHIALDWPEPATTKVYIYITVEAGYRRARGTV